MAVRPEQQKGSEGKRASPRQPRSATASWTTCGACSAVNVAPRTSSRRT